MPVAQLASRLTPRGWLIAGAGTVAAILFIYLFVHTVSQPSYTTLVSGVNPSQTDKMTSTLSAQGISYELQSNGTAIAVQANQASKARVALAGANLLGNTQPGFTQLFEKQNLGESNFQQQVTYQRALQGQLAETIDSVQGVSGAQVELVLPSSQNQIFGENQNASSAAVLLSGTSSLSSNSVRGIAQLVSSSVPGLQLDKVTITGASGELLWPAGAGGGAGGSGSEVQEAQQRYDQSMAASLDAMLGQTLGPGKAQVLVYANMNVNKTTKESLEYAKAGTPLQQSKSTRNAQRHRHRRGRRDGHREPPGRRDRQRRQVELQARNDDLDAGGLEDRDPLDDRPRNGRKPARVGASGQIRAGRVAAGDPRSDHQRRGHPDQARRHDLDRPGRVRQARERCGGEQPARRRQVRAAGSRRDLVPVLHDAVAAQARAGDDRGAGVAARTGGSDETVRARARDRRCARPR